MTGLYLQVRMNSTRLPGKALLELPGGNVIRHAMRALSRVEVDIHALVTDKESAPYLAESARAEKFDLFCGPEEDVLARYIEAARYYGTNTVIRATGDNPLVSPRLAEKILEIHKNQRADLSHFTGLPVGAGVEVVELRALILAAERSSDPFEHEHLTTYLYRNRDMFKVLEIPCPASCACPEEKISLDTTEDFNKISRIFYELYRGDPLETETIVRWINNNREPQHGRILDPTSSVNSGE